MTALPLPQFDGSPEAFVSFKFEFDLKIRSRKDLSDRDKLVQYFDCLTGPFKTTFLLNLCPSGDFDAILKCGFDPVYDSFKAMFGKCTRVLTHLNEKFRHIPKLTECSGEALRLFIDSLRPIESICAAAES